MILGGDGALHTDRHLSLLNSQFREIVTDGAVITGELGTRPTMPFMFIDPANPQIFRRSTAKEFLTAGFEEERGLLMMLFVRSFRYDAHDARAGAKHVRRCRANGRLHGAAVDVRRPERPVEGDYGLQAKRWG
jgi:hypothetical protein